MKKNDLLVFLFSGLFFGLMSFIIFSLSFEKEYVSYNEIKKFENTVKNFQEFYIADEKIDLNVREKNFLYEELIESSDPRFFQEERYRAGIVIEDMYSCDGLLFLDKKKLTKDEIWRQFSCNERTELPFGFFNEPPYLSRSGYSFAYLATYSHEAAFIEDKWVRANRQYFSMPELLFSRKIRMALKIPDFTYGDKNLSQMLLRSPIIKDGQNIYLLKNSKSVIYEKYKLASFLKHLKSEDRFFLNEKINNCVYRFNSSCFSLVQSKSLSNKNSSFKILSSILLIGSLFFFFIFIKKHRFREKEEGLRKLALDNLTHDLRTPVSNLIILSEKMDELFTGSNKDHQMRWLELSSQIHKLRRLTEDTKHYVHLMENKRVEFEKLLSLKVFLSSFESNQVEVFFKKDIGAIYTNPYWLHTCIKNLVNNAITHGLGQVVIRVEETRKNLLIEVRDSGLGLKNDLHEMGKEFVKSSESEGLGLGLSIVLRAVEVLDGELEYKSNPTRFILKIRKHLEVRGGDYAKNINC